MRRNSVSWPEDKLTALREHIDAGVLSYRQIGQIIGYSRSAVSGMVSRLGLGTGRKVIPVERKLRAMIIEAPILAPEPMPAGPHVADTLLTVPDRGRCKWPMWGWEIQDAPVCSAPCAVTESYCVEHRRVSWVKTTRKDAAAIAAQVDGAFKRAGLG